MAERVKAKLQFSEHPEFPVTNEVAIMNSRDICKHVNSIFSRVFADYLGSNVIVDQGRPDGYGITNHPVQIELYFQLGKVNDNADKKLVAFDPITTNAPTRQDGSNGKRMNYIQMTTNHNYIITHNKSSVITQNAIDIFVPMLQMEVARSISADPKASELEQKGVIVEGYNMDPVSTAAGTPQKVIFNSIRFLDINSILYKLFTAEEDEGNVFYQVTPIKPIIPMINGYMAPNNTDPKWLFQVARLNKNNIISKCNEMGVFQSANGMNMYTETFK